MKKADPESGPFHSCGAFLVVVSHGIDPRAHGIAPHQPSIIGLQQFGRRSRVPHPRIEPQVVAVWVEDDGHAVVDGRGHSIWGRGQDRAGLNRVAASIILAIPDSCEREQLSVIDFKAVRLLCTSSVFPLVERICGDHAPAEFERIPEGGLRPRRFRPCVNHLGGDRRVFRPRWNESPAD
jgi:hypothetical protein